MPIDIYTFIYICINKYMRILSTCEPKYIDEIFLKVLNMEEITEKKCKKENNFKSKNIF